MLGSGTRNLAKQCYNGNIKLTITVSKANKEGTNLTWFGQFDLVHGRRGTISLYQQEYKIRDRTLINLKYPKRITSQDYSKEGFTHVFLLQNTLNKGGVFLSLSAVIEQLIT